MLPTARHCPAQDAVARRLCGVDVGCYWRVGWRAEAIESAAGREDEGTSEKYTRYTAVSSWSL